MRKRLEDQDKRVRQLEAGETVLSKRVDEQGATIGQLKAAESNRGEAFATVRYVVECMEDVKNSVEQNENFTAGALDLLKERLRKHMETTRGDIETLTTRTEAIMTSAEEQEGRHEADMRAAERRWENELNRVERLVDEKVQEQETHLREATQEHPLCKAYVDRRLAETLERLEIVGLKDSWARELDRRDQQRREEWEKALQQRPTYEQLATTFTSLETTRTIVDRLADFQANTDQQHHRLHAGLSTVERLFLRQMDAAARMVCTVVH